MKLIQNRKSLAIAAIMAFLLSGIAFICIGYRTMPEFFAPLEGCEVLLLPGDVAAQRILGNDMRLRSMDIIMEDVNASEEARLDVTLMEGGWDEETGVVKEKMTYNVGDLSKGSRLHLDFAKTKLLYNRDYFVVFRLEDRVDGAFICMEGSDEGQGLYVNGVNYGIALAHSREFSTYQSKIFFLWKLIFVFVGPGVCLCIWRKCNFLEAIGTVTIGIALWMYLCAIIGFLKEGYLAIIVFSVMAFAFIARWIIKNSVEETYKMWSTNIQWGIVCFLVVLMMYFIADSGNQLAWWDELHQWGMEVKSMYMFDKLPFHEKAKVSHYRYPPLNPIFQYGFLQLYGKMSDSIMLLARHFFEAVIILEGISSLEKKAKNKALFILSAVLICIGLSEIFEPTIQYGLPVDMTVGAVFGFLLVKYQKLQQNYSIYNLSVLIMASMALVLIKENGLVLVLAFLSGITSIEFLRFVLIRQHKSSIKNIHLRTGLGVVTGAILGEVSWELFVHNNIKYVNVLTSQSVSAASNFGSRNRIIDYFIGRGEEYQYQLIPLHIKNLLFGNYYDGNIMQFSFGLCVFILVALLTGVGVLLYKDKMHFQSEICSILATAIFVLLAFQLLYTFVFSKREALLLAGEERYLGSFLVGITVLVIYLIGSDKKLNALMLRCFLCMICVVIILLTDSCALYRERILCKPEPSADQIRAMNLRKEVTENDKVYWISNKSNDNVYYNYFYYMAPVKLYPAPAAGIDMSFYPTLDSTSDSKQFQIGVNEWKEILSDYDYLYIEQCDSTFEKNYGIIFENPAEISSNTLYKINPGNEKIVSRYKYMEY